MNFFGVMGTIGISYDIMGYCKNSCSKTMYNSMTISTMQRWFKSASSLTDCICCQPLYIVFVADLVKYRLSAVVSLLCYGDPNRPSSRRSRVRSIECCRAQRGRRQLRADGRGDDVPTSCSVLYIHTKQHVPNHKWEHPASHEGSWTKAPSDNAWSSWLNPKWMVK